MGWESCDDNPQPEDPTCPEENDVNPPLPPIPELPPSINFPPFDFEEYMNGVLDRVSDFEQSMEDLQRRRRACIAGALIGEAGTQGLTKMGTVAGGLSSSAAWRSIGTKFVPGIGWVSTGATVMTMGQCFDMTLR